ncbi:aldolase [Paramicrobacterium agarici]|uniref:Sulfofructosephosphate aldolase n=1 Tax=Paramicrobacterium agarici TaxID=630514 RepID=A0A2A9DUR3_9MICO|nr:aldolase [Microbacterium agarici]PFG29895.1 sulfofructosephosphate aldolase [Microbacterium agarici]
MSDPTTLARPSGGFAMLAVDQREALRDMMSRARSTDISDADMTEFKVAATRALTPYASAVLVDTEFAWDAVVEQNAVASSCSLIAAADRFVAGENEFVRESTFDTSLDYEALKRQGAKALKLLVLWREDQDPQSRVDEVRAFVDACRELDLVSIIEPVSRGRWDGEPTDVEAGVLAAAKELGDLGADIYKAEVPFKAAESDDRVYDACRELTDSINGPWVVLSSGVNAERFPDAVAIACRAGASGFLAGRAVWASVLGAESVDDELRTVSIPRLERLGAIVDENIRN